VYEKIKATKFAKKEVENDRLNESGANSGSKTYFGPLSEVIVFLIKFPNLKNFALRENIF